MEGKKSITISLGTLICIIIIILLLITIGGMWYYYNYTSNQSQDTKNMNNNVSTNLSNSNKDLSNYIGMWYVSDDNIYNGMHERELTISKINEDEVTFTLEIFRIDGFENVVGKINDNVASFTGEIEGNITFKDNTIVLKIVNSRNKLVCGTTVLNKKSAL